jgi:ferrous iron transport protein B
MPITVTLAGLPNSGKSSLFNILTGSNQRIANYPGVTVEKKKGEYEFDDDKINVIDLPGIYSLDVTTIDEKISKDYLLNKTQTDKADINILVVDVTNLKKSLYLALQLREINQKFIIALNMIDLADKRGMKVDIEKLSSSFDAPVIITSAAKQIGIEELKNAIKYFDFENPKIILPVNFQSEIKKPAYIKEKLKAIDDMYKEIVITDLKPDNFTARVDRFILHPFWGIIILMTTLFLMFQLLFSWSGPLMDGIDTIFGYFGTLVNANVSNELLRSLVVDGIFAGVGGIVIFLPHIILLFVFILFLEDVGYLGRAAFLMDSLMRKLGLPGKAVIPLLSSHACAIPGIMSARIIENEKDRLATVLVAPLTTCSARIPVYMLLIAALVPNISWMGFSLPAVVLFGLYMAGIISAFIMAFILKKTTLNGPPTTLLMEMPPYRVPRFSSVIKGAWNKGKAFLIKAGTVILVLSILIWVLVSFPKDINGKSDINNSYAAKIGKTFEPIFRPIGFDWKITTALIPSFGAREVVVSALAAVLAQEGADEENAGFIKKVKESFPSATLISLLVWFIYAPQCIATFAVMKRETNGWKWPTFMGIYTLSLAYILSFVAYRIALPLF